MNMQFTLSDILTILTGIGALVAVYSALKKSIIESKILIDQHQKEILEQKQEIGKLVSKLEQEQTQRDVDNKELWTKLVKIESAQSKTNVFLEENLKSINKLLSIHDSDIKVLQKRVGNQDENMTDLWKNYDIKKKSKE